MGAPERPPSLTYDAPEGWEKLSDPGQLRIAAFRVQKEGEVADVGIAAFPGMAGGLLRNINRWRDKVKLGPIDADQLEKVCQQFQVAGQPALYVDFVGPENDQGRERLLGIIAAFGGYSWFFTMKGPPDLVGQQKATFKTFVQSVKFDGAKGDIHE
jgi:hypothetical protein